MSCEGLLDRGQAHIPVGIGPVHVGEDGLCSSVNPRRLRDRPQFHHVVLNIHKKWRTPL